LIEPFEAALADLLADALATEDSVAVVTRWRDGMPNAQANAARVAVLVVDGALTDQVGGDRDEELRVLGDISLRSSVRLGGRIRISVEVATANQPAAQQGQRPAVMRAADSILVVLHDPAVRTGEVWGDDHDQGFAIDRFRLNRLEQPAEPPDQFRRLDVWCDYVGRFWPVEPLVEGELIEEPVRIRIATMDAVLPSGRRAQSGGPDVIAPVLIDLRTLGGAPARLVARLGGAAPPGELIGDADAVPAGSVAYEPIEGGRFEVRFRPADVLAGSAVARVVLSLAAEDHPTVRIGEFAIAVEA